ncbi:hypothetical protein M758_3G267200 [Ceratodon purpureus]|nr:hypothetical protein M758_3G267200 [Ceratodon purpureus]
MPRRSASKLSLVSRVSPCAPHSQLPKCESVVVVVVVAAPESVMMIIIMMLMMGTRWRALPPLLLLCLLCACSFSCPGAHGFHSAELPVLRVGEERKRESLAFFDGSSCEYEVQGLQEGKWYEIKISYPSCIPASFDIRFSQHSSDYRRREGRKLLNIEKTIFYVTEDFSQQEKTAEPWGRVNVEVHPAGVISKHLSSDHPSIIFNILCEEVIFGIPKQAWWVGCLAALVICSAFYISARLPATLVPANARVAKDLKEVPAAMIASSCKLC